MVFTYVEGVPARCLMKHWYSIVGWIIHQIVVWTVLIEHALVIIRIWIIAGRLFNDSITLFAVLLTHFATIIIQWQSAMVLRRVVITGYNACVAAATIIILIVGDSNIPIFCILKCTIALFC